MVISYMRLYCQSVTESSQYVSTSIYRRLIVFLIYKFIATFACVHASAWMNFTHEYILCIFAAD